VRGFGWGGALLAAGLMELQRRGVQRCIIDWTTLADFYGKHGFEKSRIYRSAKLII
jgi:predicted N-acetyltransferase YhbS